MRILSDWSVNSRELELQYIPEIPLLSELEIWNFKRDEGISPSLVTITLSKKRGKRGSSRFIRDWCFNYQNTDACMKIYPSESAAAAAMRVSPDLWIVLSSTNSTPAASSPQKVTLELTRSTNTQAQRDAYNDIRAFFNLPPDPRLRPWLDE